jgi:hypothetical protein
VDRHLARGEDAAAARVRAGPEADKLADIYNFMELVVLNDKAAFFTAAEAGLIPPFRYSSSPLTCPFPLLAPGFSAIG